MARGKADRKRVAEMKHLPRPTSVPVQHLQLSSEEEEGITKIQAMVCVLLNCLLTSHGLYSL
jgi:hypothetical protein